MKYLYFSGYLSFEAERRGGDVTSIDLSVDQSQMAKQQATERDWVPRANEDWKKDLRAFMDREVLRRNAFWYAHKALNSKSRLINIIFQIEYLSNSTSESHVT